MAELHSRSMRVIFPYGFTANFITDLSRNTGVRVTVSDSYFGSSNEPEGEVTVYGPADGSIQAVKALVNASLEDSAEPLASIKFLIDEWQAINLTGEYGGKVRNIKVTSDCDMISMFGKKRLPSSASPDDFLLEVAGKPASISMAVDQIVPYLGNAPTVHPGLNISNIQSVQLPDELLHQVFLVMPPKHVSKFKCLSREWNLVISSRQFMETHFRCSSQNKNVRVLTFYDPVHALLPEFLDYDSQMIDSRACVRSSRLPRVSIDFDYFYMFGNGRAPCICNGLVCFEATVDVLTPSIYLIWNPTTGKNITIQIDDFAYFGLEYSGIERAYVDVLYGFGHNSIENDFKIISLVNQSPTEAALNIYSVKGSGLPFQQLPMLAFLAGRRFYGRGVYLNGFVHWMERKASGTGKASVISVNLERMRFEDVIILPDYDNECWNKHLEVMDGKLTFVLKRRIDDDTECEIMVMNEFGVYESWTRLDLFFWSYPLSHDQKPLCLSKKRGLLVFQTRPGTSRYIMYNPDGGIQWEETCPIPIAYVESLYSPVT